MSAPKLRFKEFDGDWGKTTILDISTLVTKGTTPKVFVEGRINFLKIEAINGNSFDLAKCQTISDEIHEKELKRSILQEGDILFAIAGATIGKNAIVTESVLPANTNQALAIIRLDDKNGKEFVSKVLNSPLMEKYIESNISTGAQPNLNLQQIGNFAFNLPSKPEQTKIASFLSAVDEKISQLTQKHELLSQYKQGMMQKLFSQQVRFKADDGGEFGEWEETTLSEIIEFVNGKGHENDVDESGNFTLINSKFISTDGIVSKNVNKCHQKVINDCLVMVMSDIPNGKALAKVLHISDGSKFALNQRIGMFIFSKENYPKFFQYQLNRHKYYLSFDSGVGQTNLKKEDVLGCPTFIPCLEEQTKIANFLSAIDQKIEVVAQQIEQAKQWKKGLLQQMFV